METRIGGGAADQLAAVVAAVTHSLEGGVVRGLYLFGSAVAGGLRPDSDLDLIAVTSRRLRNAEREGLVAGILPISERDARPRDWRPLELTVVAEGDVRPWRYPPHCDFLYGEWLRDAFGRGETGPPGPTPDLAIVVAMARGGSRALVGPPAVELLPAVPRDDLRRAMRDELPSLLDDLEHDTRNVLLTIARIQCTLETGEIRSKDEAATWVAHRLPREHRSVMLRARSLYIEGGYGEWSAERDAVWALTGHLMAEIRLAQD